MRGPSASTGRAAAGRAIAGSTACEGRAESARPPAPRAQVLVDPEPFVQRHSFYTDRTTRDCPTTLLVKWQGPGSTAEPARPGDIGARYRLACWGGQRAAPARKAATM
jgi:hypothetical protein